MWSRYYSYCGDTIAIWDDGFLIGRESKSLDTCYKVRLRLQLEDVMVKVRINPQETDVSQWKVLSIHGYTTQCVCVCECMCECVCLAKKETQGDSCHHRFSTQQ